MRTVVGAVGLVVMMAGALWFALVGAALAPSRDFQVRPVHVRLMWAGIAVAPFLLGMAMFGWGAGEQT